MKKMLLALASAASLACITGCVIAPAPGYGYGYGADGYYAPAGVVYVAPTYVAPGPGWGWRYHERYGWGWYHPQYGWHRGWR